MPWRILRSLFRKPAPVITTILCLGLGIGANTALFSILSHLLLTPLDVPDPDELVRVYPGSETGSFADLEYYARNNDTLENLVAERFVELSLDFQGTPERAMGALVSANYFAGLELTPSAGSFFEAGREDLLVGARRGVVLPEPLWRERLGGELGATVRVNGQPLPVIGVAPASFSGTYVGLEPQIWIPLGLVPEVLPGETFLENPNSRGLNFLGRLADGVQLESVRANLNALYERRRETSGEALEGWGQVMVEPLSRLHREARTPVLGFLGLLGLVSGAVLLLTCVNAANLQLARLFEDRRDTALRLALGAPRRRLYLASLWENLLISFLGCLLGLAVALALVRLLNRLITGLPVPLSLQAEPDWRVLLFASLLALLAGLALTLIPLARLLRQDPLESLRDGGGSATPSAGTARWRGLLVSTQVALSVALLVLAGLFVQSLRKAGSIDPGFQIARHLVLETTPGGLGRPGEVRLFYQELLDWLESRPEIVRASVGDLIPLTLENQSLDLAVDERTLGPTQFNVVGSGYFETLEIPILRGRAFLPEDREGSAPVAVVNETMAGSVWPDRDPVGASFFLHGSEGLEGPIVVVGVARDSLYLTLGEEPRPFFYLPFAQAAQDSMTVHIQTRRPATAERGRLEEELRAQRPDLAFTLTSMEEQLGIAYFLPRALASLLGGFGLLGLMLTVLGVYGIVSFFVSQSRQELGIRISLGGTPRHILRLILRRGASGVIWGTLLGTALALPLAGLVRGLLYGVEAHDPLVFVSVALILLLATLAASAGPAWRAIRLDPVKVLKAE